MKSNTATKRTDKTLHLLSTVHQLPNENNYCSVTDVTVQASLAFHMDLPVVDVYDF